MATEFEVLEIGQGNKEVLINTNFSKVPRYLGEHEADPAVLDVPEGSTYYNLTQMKLKVLRSNKAWVNVA